ncbi:kinase-like domain-containing protein [Aspergillus pseudotamarii]|uniref:non-specific serine/threonine protein kinase n=1 Tax=Aspergillus pseudotamarii TaxID=132259 RepID=A0A5N6SZ59_ASPPS|nr:kinase-like domain-containing protein [Aspergillus pseudotamarii]KAE8138713.1 kinase-like domain-containing protein [Aspergillus pseudotamarii]
MPHETMTKIQEGTQVHRLGGFHPVYFGDVFKDRYKVLIKIGYGVYSAVWLVRDLEPARSGLENQFRALKLGYDYVCYLLDGFEHRGPNGTHVSLVYELMGETLRSFVGAWFAESRLATSVMRRFTIQLLLVIDLAHEHDVIHTKTKPDNIFVKFRDHSLIKPGYLADVAIPQQDQSEGQYSVVPSTPLRRYFFNEADSRCVDEFDIALGDWGPAPWDASTDFWNLGAVVLEVMFSGLIPPDGHYELKEHLAENVKLLEPFPNQTLARDAPPINRPGLASDAFMPGLDQEARDTFASFLHAMMKTNPAERVSAEDLLRHPWLDAL